MPDNRETSLTHSAGICERFQLATRHWNLIASSRFVVGCNARCVAAGPPIFSIAAMAACLGFMCAPYRGLTPLSRSRAPLRSHFHVGIVCHAN